MNKIVETFSVAPSTNLVAAGAVVSPFWLPYLQTTSDLAGLMLPILGVSWLIIQMISHFRKKK